MTKKKKATSKTGMNEMISTSHILMTTIILIRLSL